MKNFKIYFTIIILTIFPKNQILTMEFEKFDPCIHKIPIDIKKYVFTLLTEKDFLKARQVCNEWHNLCQITGSEKILVLTHKKLGKKEANILVNLPFSNLILNNCILKKLSILIMAESNKYKKLGLNNTAIGDSGLKILSKNLNSLTSLSINKDKISYFGILELTTGNFSSLISLSLNEDTIGDTSAKELFGGKTLTSLTSLSLSGNYIGDEAVSLLNSENFPHLISLDLSDNLLGKDVKQELKNKFPIEIKL